MNKKLVKKIVSVSIACSLLVPLGVGIASKSEEASAINYGYYDDDYYDYDDYYDDWYDRDDWYDDDRYDWWD